MTLIKNNAELETIFNDLTEIGKNTTEVSPKVGYAIAKNRIAIQKVLEPYTQVKDEIIQKHSNGTGHINADDNPEEFAATVKDLNEIALEESSVEISTINLDDLGEKELPINMMMSLLFMIEE